MPQRMLHEAKASSGAPARGRGATQRRQLSASVPMPPRLRVAALACGINHTLALTADGQVFAWGCGRQGKLGTGDCVDKATPTRVRLDTATGDSVARIAAGEPRSCVCRATSTCAVCVHTPSGSHASRLRCRMEPQRRCDSARAAVHMGLLREGPAGTGAGLSQPKASARNATCAWSRCRWHTPRCVRRRCDGARAHGANTR